jgi:coproporphyrinogen III oxidase-like Fe-S oxidoreductase
MLADGLSPELDREELTPDEQHTERVMLRLRLASGLPLDLLDDAARAEAGRAADQGLLDPAALRQGRAVLTRPGRLLADRVVQDLLLASEAEAARA